MAIGAKIALRYPLRVGRSARANSCVETQCKEILQSAGHDAQRIIGFEAYPNTGSELRTCGYAIFQRGRSQRIRRLAGTVAGDGGRE